MMLLWLYKNSEEKMGGGGFLAANVPDMPDMPDMPDHARRIEFS
jgi:hypothetical protein